jgi:predicted transcriptional regulator
MRRSKLELYEDILSALFDKHLSVDSLATQCDMDCIAVEKRLEFLMKNNLVRKSNIKKKKLYTLTARGETVDKTLNIMQRMNKLKTSIEVFRENVHAIPVIREQK